MTWREIFKRLAEERTVDICYEASIGVKLRKVIGDIPVYNFMVQYFNEKGLQNEELSTFDDLLNCIDCNAKAFRKCDECEGLVTDGFYTNKELKEDYCCKQCLIESLDNNYGKGNWRIEKTLDNKEIVFIRVEKDFENEGVDYPFDSIEDIEEELGTKLIEDETEDKEVDFLKELDDDETVFDMEDAGEYDEEGVFWRLLDLEYNPPV